MLNRDTSYKINRSTFRVMYGDITQLAVDVLVSSDDNHLSMGGGVSGSLLRAGGEMIRTEAQRHVPLGIGDVAVTSAGSLPARYIFHAVTIDYTHKIQSSEESIQMATHKCMELADALRVRSIAFPALGTGVANFPLQSAAKLMTQTIADYLARETRIELVTLTLFARKNYQINDPNLFYEQAVGLASVYIQSKRLNTSLAQMRKIVDQANLPSLSQRVTNLQLELEHAQDVLSASPEDFEKLDELSKQAIAVSSAAHRSMAWFDNQLEAQVLRTKRDGLHTLHNIQTKNLSRYQIEKAKYGGQLVPPRLEFAIEELEKEIADTQTQLDDLGQQMAMLNAN